MSNRRSNFEQFHRLIRDFPRYNNFSFKAYGTSLTPVESHFLLEVDSQEDLTLSEIALVVGVTKSTLSNLKKSLQKKKLLVSYSRPHNSRCKFLRLTKKGKNLLEKLDRQSNSLLKEFCYLAKLNGKELKTLCEGLECIATAIDAPSSSRRKREHILRAVIRRLTRAYGLLGQNVFGIGLNTLQWQVLLEILLNQNGPTMKEILNVFLLPWATLSQTVRVLSDKGLIERIEDRNDSRSQRLVLSSKGRDIILKVESRQIDQLVTSLTGFRESEFRKFLSLIRRFMMSAAVHFYLIQTGYQIKKVSSKQERQRLRKLMVDNWAANNPVDFPDTFFSKLNPIWALVKDSEIVAGCELDNKTGKYYNFACLDGLDACRRRTFVSWLVLKTENQGLLA